MKVRRRVFAGTAAVAVAVLAASPAAASGAAAKKVSPKAVVPPPPACSGDIIQAGSVPGGYDGRNLTFSYDLAGAACLNGTYSLLIRNNYNPKQWWLFIQRGDGKSKEIVFNQRLPWKPTNPFTTEPEHIGDGLCVQGITTVGLQIVDIAPDPEAATCAPLKGYDARAFH